VPKAPQSTLALDARVLFVNVIYPDGKIFQITIQGCQTAVDSSKAGERLRSWCSRRFRFASIRRGMRAEDYDRNETEYSLARETHSPSWFTDPTLFRFQVAPAMS
jgi:hypothetical protein